MRLIKHPVLCNYYVTYRCNASCHFCDIWEKPSPYVTLEDAAHNLDDLRKLGVKVIDFTGGEPLLHRDLATLLRMAKERGFITTVTTNGLLYPKRAKELQGLVDMLHFSLDYADASAHDAARGVACFDKVVESLDIAASLGERPDILMTVFAENIGDIAPIFKEICQSRGLMLLLNPAFDYADVETGSPLDADALDQLSTWGKKPGVYINEGFLALRRDGGNHIKNPVCKAASSTIVISPKNELVMPCYHLGFKNIPIKQNLYALYHSDKVKQEIALEGRHEACEGCVINCYMQPSFAVEVNKYWWKALGGTLKYNLTKGTWKQLLPGRKAVPLPATLSKT